MKLLVNDREEIEMSECHPSPDLFGCRLNSSSGCGTVSVSSNLPISDRGEVENSGCSESVVYAQDQHTGRSKSIVYVLNQDGKPLMPCKFVKAKHLLRDGKAKVVSRLPFTIKLLWQCECNTQEVVGGLDTGSVTIGCAAVSDGKVLYMSEVKLRNDITKKMVRRKSSRIHRRMRHTRYRPERWGNRASSLRKGRLAPTLLSKLNSHYREISFVESILPITRWKVELANFDINRIENPDVDKSGHKDGQQKSFYNTKAYIVDRDAYCCKGCRAKNVPLQVHHIIFRSNGGTNIHNNLVSLCKECHEKVHRGELKFLARKSVTKHAGEVGVIKSQLKKGNKKFETTYGYETKFKREVVLGLPKTHYYDAIAICFEDEDNIKQTNSVVFMKRHIAGGDYKQTKGSRSEKKVPTGKLFGVRRYDLVKTDKGIGFVKGKRVNGFFEISTLGGRKISGTANMKKPFTRITARSTTLIDTVVAI